MAGHKTKYKKPKDLEASQTKAFIKKHVRKALKDYILDDKDGGMNPNSTNEYQKNVLRKTDKPYEDTGDILPKNSANYYKVEGDHDSKYTAKERSKLQDEDEKMSKEQIQDKIENLTREQKERLVREYVRRKITKILAEDKDAKPDYIDLDDDGDKKEPMKKAAADKKEKEQLKDSIVKEQEGEEEGGEDPTEAPAPAEAPAAPAAEEPAAEDSAEDVSVNIQDKWQSYLTGTKGTSKTIDRAIKPLANVLSKLDPADKNIAKRQLNRHLRSLIRFLGSEETENS
tara:strand:+ start:442 stop:1296 length:855 start_codon:yes stop_codon:yes gene_type:complete